MVKKLAAIVFTATDRLPDHRMSGHWLAEAAYPWLALADAGWRVVSISTTAATPRPGGVDRTDRTQRRYLEETDVRRALAGTCRAEHYDPADFGAVVFAGGAGAVFDLPDDRPLGDFAAAVLTDGGLVAGCGYGLAGLVGATAGDRSLLKGRRLTTTSPAEERAQDLTALVPVRLTDELSDLGAVVQFGEAFRPHVVVDGPLITGQNPASAPALAARLLERLARFNATTAPSPAHGSEAR